MAISQIAVFGDSLTQGMVNNVAISQGGQGGWVELLAEMLGNIAGIGPLISSGFRSVVLGTEPAEVDTEWAYAPVYTDWTAPGTSAPYEKGFYGGGRWANGPTKIVTFTNPSQWRTPVGYKITFVDKGSGGNWQYRLHGGTWTNHNQALLHDDSVVAFYVAAPIGGPYTVDIRCSSDATTGVDCLPLGIEVFFVDPTTATSGVIVHNNAVNGLKLANALTASAGDRLACLDSVRLGTGSPITSTPHAGVLMMHINDVLDASTSAWDARLTALNARASPLGPVGFINVYGVSTASYNDTQQTNYRAHTKTTAAGFAIPAAVLDLFDAWSAMGWGSTNALQSSQGITDGRLGSDGVHEAQDGQLDLATRIYWFVRNNFFNIGKAGNAFVVGSSAVGGTAVLGGMSNAMLPDGKALAVTAGTPTIAKRNTVTTTGKAIAVTAGTPTLHGAFTAVASGKAIAVTAGVPTLHGSNTIAATGKAVAVTAGTSTVRALNTVTASGKAIAVTAGTAALKATNTIAATGKAITITPGGALLRAPGLIAPAGHAIQVIAGSLAVTGPGTIAAVSGKAIQVTAGAAIVHPGGVTRTTTGKAIAVTAGAPSLKATNRLLPSGKAIAVTAGTVTTASHATITPAGKAISVTAGAPTLHGAGLLVTAGHAISVTAGAAVVRSVRTILPAGKAIAVVAGTSTVHVGTARIHPAGVPILVVAGPVIFVGGQGEPATATVTIVGSPRATVTFLPGPRATVTI